MVVEHAPEVYLHEGSARLECERWLWTLSGGTYARKAGAVRDRWIIGGRDLLLITLQAHLQPQEAPWVVLVWGNNSIPVELSLHSDRRRALLHMGVRESDASLLITPWSVTLGSPTGSGLEGMVAAHRCKLVQSEP
jgi:hypothetical protein